MVNDRFSKRSQITAVILLTWLFANSFTHIVVWCFTRKIYYQLSPLGLIIAEASINFLNLVTPLVVAAYFFHKSFFDNLKEFGWGKLDWKTPIFAVTGLGAFLILCAFSNKIFGNSIISYNFSGMSQFNPVQQNLLFLQLLLLTPIAEEMMFRGFLQTKITELYTAKTGIWLTAVLFALRHHPSDIFFGVVNNIPLQGWLNRLVQLYGGALILSLVRYWARSTWASWLLHVLLMVLILVLGGN